MMRNLLLGAVALLIAGAAALLARDWLEGQRAALLASIPTPAVAEAMPTTMVLVATTDLAPGHFVKPEQLRWHAWPADAVSPAHVVQGKRENADFVGAVARSTVLAGEPVTDARFVKPGDRGFLAAVLDRGMRAITVPITAISGNAGFVFPGDRVDLILTSRMDEGGQASQFAVTVLEAVRVLAIDQRLSHQGSEVAPGKTATLELTPKMAEKVVLALQMGTLSLSLRSLGETPADHASEPETGPDPVIDRELYTLPPATPGTGQAGRPTLLLLRGGTATKVEF